MNYTRRLLITSYWSILDRILVIEYFLFSIIFEEHTHVYCSECLELTCLHFRAKKRYQEFDGSSIIGPQIIPARHHQGTYNVLKFQPPALFQVAFNWEHGDFISRPVIICSRDKVYVKDESGTSSATKPLSLRPLNV